MPSCWPSSRLQLKTSPILTWPPRFSRRPSTHRCLMPGRSTLEGLLRARRPTPGWVEILTLHRLAERALAIIQGKRPEESWKPETVRKLLGVRQGR